MKTPKILFALIGSSIALTAFGQQNNNNQQEQKAKKKIKIAEASVFGGGNMQHLPIAGSLSDFQKLNPESALLKQDMSGFGNAYGTIYTGVSYVNMNNYGGNSGANTSNGGLFGANVAFNLGSKDAATAKSITQLRCGITVSGTNFSNYLSKTTYTPYDTLVSSSTGQTFYYDSINTQSYQMNYKSQQLSIDIALLYRINPASRWSLYGGIGVQAGGSLMAYSDITYSQNISYSPGYSSNYSNSNSYYNSGNYYNQSTTEHFINKNTQQYLAYLPIGVDFRLGKKREFFKQIHLFNEIRPYVYTMKIPELASFSGIGFRTSFGIRVTI